MNPFNRTPEQVRNTLERYIADLHANLRYELTARRRWLSANPLDRKARVYRMLALRYSIAAARQQFTHLEA